MLLTVAAVELWVLSVSRMAEIYANEDARFLAICAGFLIAISGFTMVGDDMRHP